MQSLTDCFVLNCHVVGVSDIKKGYTIWTGEAGYNLWVSPSNLSVPCTVDIPVGAVIVMHQYENKIPAQRFHKDEPCAIIGLCVRRDDIGTFPLNKCITNNARKVI